jgi:type IV pilus biogenesis protein CpaD/CtpE
MRQARRVLPVLALMASALAAGCASTGTSESGTNRDILTREEILGAEATNLYDVIRRLRPRWLQVRSTRSFSMETEIAVLQNDMYLGTSEQLKEMAPELAFEIRYLEGARAATAIPGLMSGRHIEGAIVISTKPGGGG